MASLRKSIGILLVILSTNCIAQDSNDTVLKTGHKITGHYYFFDGMKLCPCSNESSFIYPLGGVLFFPMSKAENKPDSILTFCVEKKRVYFLEGLEVPETAFLKLGLKQKDIINDKACYFYTYRNQDTTDCIEQANLYLSVNIPIKLNGLELQETKKGLKQIAPEQLLTVTRVKSFFGKGFIEITTKVR